MKRNYSFFTNLFYGQFQNVMECPECNNNSIKIDPFQIVSLSIPEQSKIEFVAYFIPQNHKTKNIKSEIKIKSIHKYNDFQVSEIKKQLCSNLKTNEENCVLTNLDFNDFPKIYENSFKISSIIELGYSSYNKPNILLYQFSNFEMQQKIGSWQYLNLKIVFENELIGDSHKYRYSKNKDVYTLFTIANEQTTVKLLYRIIFEKLFYASSFANEYQLQTKDEQFFDSVWENLLTKHQQRIFFYLMINDEKTDRDSLEKLSSLVLFNKKVTIKIVIS